MNHHDKTTGNLLIEIGTEELPAQSLFTIQKAFVQAMQDALTLAGLPVKNIHPYATPRRLALRLEEVALKQADHMIHKQGPTKTLALNVEGHWTPAALGFAASCGIDPAELSFEKTDKGERLVVVQNVPGQSIEQLIQPILTKILMTLSVGKRMRLSKKYTFSRPLHWIVLLLNDQAIKTEIFDIQTDRLSHGHRFHHPKVIAIQNVNEYETSLEKSFVMPDFQKRRAHILKQIETLKPINTTVCMNEELLDEVTSLVEWPVVLIGHFKKDFLKLPAEVLITAMQTHQKCFAIQDEKQRLLPKFVMVSNIESKDPQTVIQGNESVIDARLADAAFYYAADQKISPEQYREGLKQVRFQEGLGSLFDKTTRLNELTAYIATQIGADPTHCTKAALYCKNDLLSQMVIEFPTLQGVMGRYYYDSAHHLDKIPEKADVISAQAIAEHYYPRFSSDQLPASLDGTILAIADRIDNLVGLFGIGQMPTGSRDPFALRRQALGLIRLLVEKQIPLNLWNLFIRSGQLYANQTEMNNISFQSCDPENMQRNPNMDLAQNLVAFCSERMQILLEERNIKPSIFNAVRYKTDSFPLDAYELSLALHDFLKRPEAVTLIIIYKRVCNILKNINPDDFLESASELLLTQAVELILLASIARQQQKIPGLLEKKRYGEALGSLCDLAQPLEQFFSEVMVLDDDPLIRKSRLTLLNDLKKLLKQIADFSVL